MNNKTYLSTGELANMLGITKQTLIYYDNIGLISPAERDDKNYRYYTLEQADELDSILTFRNLGVPINTLKEYLSVRNVEGCIEMLGKQKEQYDMEIQRLDKVRKKIEKRSNLLEEVLRIEDFEKVDFIKENSEMYMIEPCVTKDGKSSIHSFIAICNRSKELQIDFENPICEIITKEDLINGNYKSIAFCGIKIPDNFTGEISNIFEKPQGIYASTYHKGSYDTMYLSYERLIKFIKDNGYKICGCAYETDLLSILTSSNSEEYLRHISVQVCN